MNNLSFFTPIEIDTNVKDSIQMRYGLLRHCAHFICPNFSGRKVYIIGQKDGNLIVDLDRKKETVSKVSHILTIVLKIAYMTTLIFPILALIGTIIFHRSNTFIDKNTFKLPASNDINRNVTQTVISCDVDSIREISNNIENAPKGLPTKSTVSEDPLIPSYFPSFPIISSEELTKELTNPIELLKPIVEPSPEPLVLQKTLATQISTVLSPESTRQVSTLRDSLSIEQRNDLEIQDILKFLQAALIQRKFVPVSNLTLSKLSFDPSFLTTNVKVFSLVRDFIRSTIVGSLSDNLHVKKSSSNRLSLQHRDVQNGRKKINDQPKDQVRREIDSLFPSNSRRIFSHLNHSLPSSTAIHDQNTVKDTVKDLALVSQPMPKQEKAFCNLSNQMFSRLVSKPDLLVPNAKMIYLVRNVFLSELMISHSNKSLLLLNHLLTIKSSIPTSLSVHTSQADSKDDIIEMEDLTDDLLVIQPSDVPKIVKDSGLLELEHYVRGHHSQLTFKEIEHLVEQGRGFFQFIWCNREEVFLDWCEKIKEDSQENQLRLVSSVIWYLMAQAALQSKTFVEGSFIFPDKDHRLYRLLSNLRGSYERISSHLKGCSPKYHRGIDIPHDNNSYVLPGHKGHVLFTYLLNRAPAIFIKCEDHGTKGIKNFLCHAGGYICSLGRKTPILNWIFGSDNATGFYKERIPDDLIPQFWDLIKDIPNAKTGFDQWKQSGCGIGGMLSYIENTILITADFSFSSLNIRKGLEEFIQTLKNRFGRHGLENRIGNEVIPDLTEIMSIEATT